MLALPYEQWNYLRRHARYKGIHNVVKFLTSLMHYFEIMMVNFFFNLIWEYSDFKIPNINLEKGSAIQLINLFLWIYNWGKNLIVKKEKKKKKRKTHCVCKSKT